MRLLASHHLLRLLPTDALSALGGVLGRELAPRFHKAADRRVREGLRALRPELAAAPAALDKAASRLWENVGRSYAEFSALERLWPQGRVAVEGLEHLDAAMAGGRPVIVAGLHLGNWELLPTAFGYLGHHFIDVYQPPSHPTEARIAHRSRMRVAERIRGVQADGSVEGFRLIPPSPSAAAEILRALRAGEHFIMFVDDYAAGRVHAPSFGRPLGREGNLARVARLARLADAPVVPGYVERGRGARFTVRFLPALRPHETGSNAADLAADLRALDEVITPVVRERLDQWYMLTDFRLDR